MLLIPVSVVEADSVVTFADPNLELAVRLNLLKFSGDIYESDLVGLTVLIADFFGITSLAGLEHCTSLTTLSLSFNQISDLTPLAGLTDLMWLNLGSNQISHVAPLTSLTGLTSLNLSSNQIGDNIIPVAELTGLTSLNLSNNQISYVAPLTSLTSLTSLNLSSNQIGYIAPLAELTGLTSLNLDDNQVSDIAPLAGLTELTTLSLSVNQVSNVTPLASMTSLTSLNLSNNQISDITPLANLTGLMTLRLSKNQIGDKITPLAGLTLLTLLELVDNQISDITPLVGLTLLAYLSLSENQISDIIPLASPTLLTYLSLSENEISDIAPLAGLPSLRWLYLDNNQISDIEPLVDNPGMESGDQVYLRVNPLSCTSQGVYIPQLQARGVTVVYDPTNQTPIQPGNISPANGAVGVILTPTLQSSAFSDLDTCDTHAASQWQVTITSGNYSSPVFDSGTNAPNLTSITVPSLSYSKTYYWHVRYQDSHGAWSFWSKETSFTTVTSSPLVTTNDASSPTTTSARLNGDLTWLGTAGSVTVSFEWKISGGSYTPIAAGVKDSIGTFSVDLDGLIPGTTYYFKAKADGDGDPVYGLEKSFTTLTGPPAVTTDDATEIGSTSATLNSNLTSLGTAGSVAVSFEWKISGGSYTPIAAGVKDSIGTFFVYLTDLTPGTTCYYQAKAVGHGTTYGEEKSFSTLPPSPSVSTVDPSSITTNSARLNGDLTRLGTASSVRVSFRWGTSPGSHPNETTGQDVIGTGTFYFDLPSLSPGTIYYYRAKAVGDGTRYGDEKSFTTATTPPAVTTNDASNLAATSATLNGHLDDLGTADGVNVSFEWGTSSGSYPNETAATAKTASGTFYLDLSGLSGGTTYYYRAKAVGHGTSYGEEKSFSTLPPSPSVSTVDPSSITTNSARLNGDLTRLGTASSVRVSFRWGTSPGLYSNETTGQDVIGTGAFHFDLPSLSPGTTYYYRAKAVGDGTSHGDEKSFTTGRKPVVEDANPKGGKRGQRLTVTIAGANFYGATRVSFGSGITVGDFDVNSSSEIVAEITIGGGTEVGARDVSVTTGWGTGTETDGFSVGEGGGRPFWIWVTVGTSGVLAVSGLAYFVTRRRRTNQNR
jgi:Leucine-rich repeat (LRR) protein